MIDPITSDICSESEFKSSDQNILLNNDEKCDIIGNETDIDEEDRENERILGFVSPVTVTVDSLYLNISPSNKLTNFFKSKTRASDLENNVQKHSILSDISLKFPSNTLTAIIGGSGSGKTSLLNSLANRMASSSLETSGEILFNGSTDLNSVSHAFVLQQDILESNLTCKETLTYAADLRLPGSTKKDRRILVNSVIRELGLSECADTMVGNSSHRGLSGGEKRRLSLGIQLLSNPSLLFLDEPTTGLDASSAFLLVQTCKRLAKNGRTIIMSIHQPRSDIFFLFDRLVVLAKGGKVSFAGETTLSISYFKKLGFNLPLHVNPADFIIDTCAIDSRTETSEIESKERVERIVNQWKAYSLENPPRCDLELATVNNTNGNDLNLNSGKASLLREIKVSTHRQFIISYRDPLGYVGLFFETIVLGIIVGWIFHRLDGSFRGLRSMQGALYISISIQGYLLLIYETYRLCQTDLKIFDRELADGCVSVTGFLLSRRLSKCLTEDLYVPLLFSIIVFFMTGMQVSARQFFVFFSIQLLSHYGSICYATMASGISRDFAIASLIGNLFFTIQFMASGYFANATHLPVYIRWTRWISTFYYMLTAACNNQFLNFVGDCPYPQGDSRCAEYTGAFIIQSMGFRLNWIAVPLGIVASLSVFYYIAAWFVLTFFPVEMSLAQGPKSSGEIKTLKESDYENETEHYFKRTSQYPAPVVEIQNLKLSITKPLKSIITKNPASSQIDILDGVTARFVPGSINAILGPSGSGKSSLLNLVADRLNSTLFLKYHSSVGTSLFFDNKNPTPSIISSLCSFVTQEDDGLLASLTVRETLYYAADLRLSSSISKERKHKIADDVIRRMGLKYCADTPIGDEIVKGISGGEKRRVSISIQLLNDPEILLLDEPTSGLDAFTAASILDVLVSLAKEGRTIICTIHQPRSDMFSHFGNILLLAKGGIPAYNGQPRELFPYLEKIGYPCPALTNPADHLLDLVSVNYQTQKKEERTKQLVKNVLEYWKCEQQLLEGNAIQRGNDNINIDNQDNLGVRKKKGNSIFSVATILISRSTLNILRSPHLIAARLLQVFGIAAILALFFAPFHDSAVGINDRMGMLQQFTALYFVGMLNNVAVYPSERAVFYREFDDGIYGVLPFFLSYTLIEIPFEAVTAMLFSVLYAVATGLGRSVGMFFMCSYCVLVIVNCGESIGIVFNTIFLHEGFAINVISVILSISTMMAGLLSLQMPVVLKAINWISPVKYSVGALTSEAFPETLKFTCEGQSIDPNTGKCLMMNGKQVLSVYGLNYSMKTYLGVLVVCMVIYRLIALLILKLAKTKFQVQSFLK